MLNEEGVYSTTTGMFTAPCDGVYEFHATLAINQNQKNLWVEFKAGDIAIGRFGGYDYYSHVCVSGSAIARLQKGTQVYLRVTSVTSGVGFLEDIHRLNNFSGHLIGN